MLPPVPSAYCHAPSSDVLLLLLLLLLLPSFISQEGRRMWSARRRLAGWGESIYDLLQQRYAAAGGVPEDDHSLAGCLMRITDKHGNKPKRGALVAEICDALTASETVPSSIMWTLYCIAVRPQLQQQLQHELAATGITSSTIAANSSSSTTCNGSGDTASLQDQGDLAPAGPETFSASGKSSAAAGVKQQAAAVSAEVLQQRRQRLLDAFAAAGPEVLKQLPLLQACLYEAMRLYPAGAPGAPRMVEQPTRVGPYLVPPGVIECSLALKPAAAAAAAAAAPAAVAACRMVEQPTRVGPYLVHPSVMFLGT
uniref:Cytochrome P450 n=1 Tax=Tetradesmus obliquus TaxID=3088 RepID=A0A383WQ16_TETOB|eukprot:jgi/Sobl393_1/4647/SZX79274.1